MKCLWLENSTCPDDLLHSMNLQQAKLLWPVIVLMIVFFLVGMIGNSLVIFVYTTKTNATSANISMLGLAVVDIFSCVLIHPYVIFKLFHQFDQDWVAACKIFEFFVHASLSVSTCMLVVIAYDRYLAICKPLQVNRGFFSYRNLLIASIVTGIASNIPILEFFGARVLVIEFENKNFETKLCEFSNKYQGSIVDSLFGILTLCAFLGCVIITTVLYCKIGKTVRQANRVHPNDISRPTLDRSHEPENILPSASTSYQVDTCDRLQIPKKSTCNDIFTLPKSTLTIWLNPIQISTVLNRPSSTKTAQILVAVTAVFLLSWIPFWSLRIAGVVKVLLNEKLKHDLLSENLSQTFIFHLLFINNAVNPIIYTGMNSRFRKDLKKVLQNIRRKLQ